MGKESVGKASVGKQFVLEFRVRDYELDQYGVVNNAVYQNYLEHTRHEFLLSVGVDPASVAAAGRSLALSQLHIRYLAPLRSRDAFHVRLTVSRLTGARVEFHQIVLRMPKKETVAEAWAEALFVDERGRPMRIPKQFLDGLGKYRESARPPAPHGKSRAPGAKAKNRG